MQWRFIFRAVRYHAVLGLTFMCCLALILLSGCASSLGPRSIPVARYQYNEAIGRSQDEQMLLNLVRLRYQDSPQFLDLDSVVASYSISTDLGVNLGIASASGEITRSLGSDSKLFGWSDSPTVTYTPLKGDEFAKRTMTPIKPELLVLLSQGGWGIERLMLCCVQQLNNLPNARRFIDLPKQDAGTAKSLAWVSRFQEFQHTVSLLRQLQDNGYIQLIPGSDSSKAILIGSGPVPLDEQATTLLKEVAKLLGVSRDVEMYFLTEPAPVRKPAEIQVHSRSLLGTMAFLAQGVEVPDKHQKEGLVKRAVDVNGRPIPSSEITLGYFRVQSSAERSELAAVQVHYRDHWYWIADTDLESKGTFTLLNQIFNLQAASNQNLKPLFTLPK